MTISNFVETYKIHLDRKGENLLIPCVARSQEDTRFIHSFCRENRQEIMDYLLKQRKKKFFRKALEASVRHKAFDVMLAWENYLYDMGRFNASGLTDKPVPPETSLDEALAALTEQELAMYKALFYARSTDLDKARCGELALDDIAAATHGYESILTRMQQDYEDCVFRRGREGERDKRYREYVALMHEMHPHPVKSYEADYDADYDEMIG